MDRCSFTFLIRHPCRLMRLQAANERGFLRLRDKIIISATIAATIFIIGFAAGCGQIKNTQPPGGQNMIAKAQEATPKTMDVAVYYVKKTNKDFCLVRESHTVAYTRRVARAALEELINGQPFTENAFTVLPRETRIRGISINNGLASVDFSSEVLKAEPESGVGALGIQGIVNTLTEFPTIEQVAFKVDGTLDQQAREWWGNGSLSETPYKRDLSNVLEPAVWITMPVKEELVDIPMKVAGYTRIVDAPINLRIVTGSGVKLAEGCARASADNPGRGEFSTYLKFQRPSVDSGYLEVFHCGSEKKCKELNKVRIPIKFNQTAATS
ncbi:MAG: Spore germination protein-like Gmad2 [Desulfotomaculum sp. 46_80]|nr:MAG: Spore germination protein-like Gmad2 [Desulfotomaculum sp. 46_80]